MIDKTKNVQINKINFTANKQSNKKSDKHSLNEVKDSFVKSKYDKKLIKSDEQMVATLAMNSFKYLASNLIKKGSFYNGTGGIKLYLDDEDPIIAVGIMDYDTEIIEQYHYKPEEFINIIKNVKEKALQRNIEPTDEYDELCSKLIEKLKLVPKKI